MKLKKYRLLLIGVFLFTLLGCLSSGGKEMHEFNPTIRVPAEWETHAGTWMQWPSAYESEMRPEFAQIIDIIQDYEPVHLLTSSEAEKRRAKQFLLKKGVPNTQITWHIVPVDNAWLRDNGPIYVTDGIDLWIQNWRFDAWGGNFGPDIEYKNDNQVPIYIGEYLGLPVEDYQDYVLEKGNLEFNGAGTLVLNWDCQDDRNPGMTQREHETILKQAFGVHTIIWAYGHHRDDGTTGHIDGIARFVDRNTLMVADYERSKTERILVRDAKEAGLEVVRYPGNPNWLVGNGFVLGMGEGDERIDADLKSELEFLFPDRQIHLIHAEAIFDSGGGIHCVTNDQPA